MILTSHKLRIQPTPPWQSIATFMLPHLATLNAEPALQNGDFISISPQAWLDGDPHGRISRGAQGCSASTVLIIFFTRAGMILSHTLQREAGSGCRCVMLAPIDLTSGAVRSCRRFWSEPKPAPSDDGNLFLRLIDGLFVCQGLHRVQQGRRSIDLDRSG